MMTQDNPSERTELFTYEQREHLKQMITSQLSTELQENRGNKITDALINGLCIMQFNYIEQNFVRLGLFPAVSDEEQHQ